MARTGITYNEVVAKIDEIIGSGDEPTIQKIRDLLGTGSPNTIHRHLVSWRQSRPVEQRKAPELPIDLQLALVKEIERQASEARAEIEKELVDTQKESDLLSKAGEELEETNAILEEENNSLLSERERLSALCDERHNELESLKKDLEREREAAEKARIQSAQSLNKIESLEEKITTLDKQLMNALAELKDTKNNLISCEKSSAVLESNLDNEKNISNDLRERLKLFEIKINDLYESIALERSTFKDDMKTMQSEHKIELEKLSSEVFSTKKQLMDAQMEIHHLNKTVEELSVKKN